MEDYRQNPPTVEDINTHLLFTVRATGTWATHKIKQFPSPSETPMTMDKFEAKVDLMFTDLNQEVLA